MRNRWNRNKQMRRVRRALEEKRRRYEQRAIPLCENCGRRAGQMVMLGAVEDPVKERPYSGGWGCERCKDGLPGEHRDPDDGPHVIKFVPAPTRDQMILDGTIS